MKDNKKTRRTIIATILAVGSSLLLLTGFRTLHDHRGQRWQSGDNRHSTRGLTEGRLDDALDHLDATDGQRGEIHAIAENMRERMGSHHDSMDRLHSAVMTQWESDTPDASGMRVAWDEEIEQLRSIGHQIVDDGVALHAVLTREQREEVAKHLDGTVSRRNKRQK